MDEENRLKITLWFKLSIVCRMDGWLEEDSCESRGEFTEKALRFYMSYPATGDTSEYLSRALVDTLRGTLADDEDRLCTLLFKLYVEANMMGHTVAAYFRVDPVNRRELQALVADEVLCTNGKVSFDDTLDFQRQVYPDG